MTAFRKTFITKSPKKWEDVYVFRVVLAIIGIQEVQVHYVEYLRKKVNHVTNVYFY